ncbi:MAG TPA: NADP-dependent oxidoreductase [Bryobacteraceae bacterium]|nr:NADP-dependent oxidoreductase [Bryobacteraceae bacterium]
MKAARIHRYGSPEVIVIDDVPPPMPGGGEVLVRVVNAGVGPWDALIREQKSVVESPLPITLGSDLAGAVEAVGPGVTEFRTGDEVYGVTNPNFVGAYAQFALANANMIARKPGSLNFEEAASAPVVAVTAWQMLFEYAKAKPEQVVLIHGAGGNVGAYAVQLAAQVGLRVFATASASDAQHVQSLGAATVIDYKANRFEEIVPKVDIVLDLVGGSTQERSLQVIKQGGILVSIVSKPAPSAAGIHSVFFLVEVTTERLDRITDLFNRKKLVARVGTVLPLEQVRVAHEMLAGAPHKPGKIVLSIA